MERQAVGFDTGRGKHFSIPHDNPDLSCGLLSLIFSGWRSQAAEAMKLSAHLHLVPRLQMSETLPLYFLMP